ncbi:MAG: 30S ribosomal protein S2 [Hyphomicrobiales bacterium]
MALPDFTMRQLLEAGVHFGHQTHRWNPKMGSYIFGSRNNIHIIDLAQTVPLLHQALVSVRDVVAARGRVLFVGTKRQASDTVAQAATRCAQYYINHRWLGGTLTNWKTISHSIARLRRLEDALSQDTVGMTKKERLNLTREREKLDRALGGIKTMGGLPDLIFVIDTNRESIAIREAGKLGIPIVAVIDTNCDPDTVTYPIPGNDDASRAIALYCDLVARAAIEGLSVAQGATGADIGEQAEPVAGILPDSEPRAESDTDQTESGTDDVDMAARQILADAGFKGLEAPRGAADDLKKISGVGPVLEARLNAFGIYHYHQLAALTPEQIAAIDEVLNFKGRIEREKWLEQARTLAQP